jgi:hypothetical protein
VTHHRSFAEIAAAGEAWVYGENYEPPRRRHATWGDDPSGHCGCDDCNAPDPNGADPGADTPGTDG